MTTTTTTSVEVSDSATAAGPAAAGPRQQRAKRRTFTAEYKQRIVAEYEAAPAGSKGAVLRREGLYDSHLQEWRAAAVAGTLATPPKRGRPRKTAEQVRITQLEKQVAKLEAETARQDGVIADRDAALEVLGKGVAFLEAISSGRVR